MDGSEWVRESILAQPAASQPTGNPDDYVRFSHPRHAHDITESSGEFYVKESYGALSISQPLEEDTTCRQGLAYVFKRFCGFCECCIGSADGSADDKLPLGLYQEDTTCWEWLKNKCKCKIGTRLARSLKARFRSTTAAEEPILLTYVGKKKNVSSAFLTNEGKLEWIGEAQSYPVDTQFWVIKKTKMPAPLMTPSGTPEPGEGLGPGEKESQVIVHEDTPNKGRSHETHSTAPSSLDGMPLIKQPPERVPVEVEEHMPQQGRDSRSTAQNICNMSIDWPIHYFLTTSEPLEVTVLV